MSQVLRFPNPNSDLTRLVSGYRAIHRALSGKKFNLDDAVAAFVDAGLVSSSGAIGAEAVRRSTRRDRSRDPLYNQLKMFSEIYRMLGWLLPDDAKRLQFQTTPLGEYVFDDDRLPLSVEAKAMVRDSILSICIPNSNTNTRGIENLRPFPQVLRLVARLDGTITRDELIISLYPMVNDQLPDALDRAAARVRAVRGSATRLKEALRMVADGRQVNTLRNYTRFPLGVITSPLTGWASKYRTRELYESSVFAYSLNKAGLQTLAKLDTEIDVREGWLRTFSASERVAFARHCFFGMVMRAGFPVVNLSAELKGYNEGSRAILDALGCVDATRIRYSPLSQADRDIQLAALKEP